MLLHAFVLAVVLFLLRTCAGDIDWSPFEVHETIDPVLSAAIIRDLPLHQYWDVQKASFRTGIIGDVLLKTHPQFTSLLSAKIAKGSNSITADTVVVDQATLFMHTLGAVQLLMRSDAALHSKYDLTEAWIFNSVGLKSSGRNQSVEELLLLQNVVRSQISRLNFTSQLHEMQGAFGDEVRQLQHATKSSQLLQIHADALTELESHYRRLNTTAINKFRDLGDTVRHNEASVREFQQEQQRTEALHAVATLQGEVQLTMNALAYRVAQELQIAEQQQEFEEQQLLATQTDLLQAEVEEVINTFFSEILSAVQAVKDHPATALAALRCGLLATLAVLVLLEIVHITLAVVRKLSGASYLPQVQRLGSGDGNSAARTATAACNWSPLIAEQLAMVQSSLVTAITHGLPLPNIIVCGPSGCGKSAMVEKLVLSAKEAVLATGACCSLLKVCGADLQALGDGPATQFLNGLLRSAGANRSRGGPLLLVIDDADCFIASRGTDTGVPEAEWQGGSASHQKRAAGCLFAILTGLRMNFPHVGLVAVARSQVSQLDEALLDRMDHALCLARPGEVQRLHFAITALQSLRARISCGSVDPAWAVLDTLCGSTHHPSVEALEIVHRALLPAGLPAAVVDALAAQVPPRCDTAAPSEETAPETDTPEQECALASAQSNAAHRKAAVVRLQGFLRELPEDSLDLLLCLRLTLALSDGWSFRELKQLFASLSFAAMCSDGCKLSTRSWARELVYSFD